MTIREDNRTPEEKKTHTWLVTATDKCLSGWGQAEGGLSKCAWACRREHLDQVERWVRSRREMKYIYVTNRPWYPKAAHVHIYVVHETHPSIN
jgi:hypothetical protein